MGPSVHPASEAGALAAADVNPVDEHVGIAALRAQGGQRLDPIGFAFAAALARRAMVPQGQARQLLDRQLNMALARCRRRVDSARTDLDQAIPTQVQRYPQAAQGLRRLHALGDAPGIRRLIARLDDDARGTLLGKLVRQIDRQAMPPGLSTPWAELKTVHRDKQAWTRLRVDQQLSCSQQTVPDNPGPLNSHLLVLRSLRRMQNIAPDYLAQFMSYAETLLWLDRAGSARGSAPVPAVPAKAKRKKPAGDRSRGEGRAT